MCYKYRCFWLKYNFKTRLWSPYAPGFDKEEAQRTANFLMVLLIVIIIAVILKIYQQDIIDILRPFLQEMIKGSQFGVNEENNDTNNVEENVQEQMDQNQMDDIEPAQDNSITR